MTIRLLRCVLAVAVALAGQAAAQAEPPPVAAPPASCGIPAHADDPLLGREARLAQFEQLGDGCLKQLQLQCHAAAGRDLLDAGTAFACSIGYEALLRRSFGGDFQALLAWWRTQAASFAPN